MKMKQPIDKVLGWGIAVLMLLVLTIVLFFIYEFKKADESGEMVSHTQEVLMHSERLLSFVIDNETSSRGYIITGKDVFLEPLKKSQRNIYNELALLKNLSIDNQIQQVRLDSLSVYVDKRVAFSNKSVSIYKLSGAKAAQAIVNTEEGKKYTDKIRLYIDQIQATENALLVQRKDINEKSLTNFYQISLVVIACVFLLLIVFLQKARLDFIERRKLQIELLALNADLEKTIEHRTTEALHARNALFETFERISDAFISIDKNWCYTYMNKSMGELIHRNPESLIGKNVWDIFPDAVGSATYEAFNKAMKEQKTIVNTDYYEPLDLWQENYIYPTATGISVFIRDISERKKAEQKIIKANRLYFFISQINQMIVRTTDEKTLFKEACRIAIDMGGFRMAWIGIIDEETKKVIPVMHAGEDDQYLSKIKVVSIDDVPEGRGPTGTALREGKYIVCNDIESDPKMAPWKEAALGRGYLSSMSLPIIKFGKVIGAFTFYASSKFFFDKAEIALLVEATGDVAFALEIFEKERLRKKAENEVAAVYKKIETTLNRMTDAVMSFDTEWRYTFLNDAALHTHPLGREGTLGKTLWEVHPGIVGTVFEEKYYEAVNTKKVTEVEAYYEPMNTWFSIRVYPANDGITMFYKDTTEQKKVEEEIKTTTEKLRQLTTHLQNIREEERIRIGREIHDELGQQLTAIKMDISWIDKHTQEGALDMKARLKSSIELLNQTNQSVRRILSELRPSILDDYDLHEALVWHGRQFTENTGVPIEFNIIETEHKFNQSTATCVFRLFQEALTNVTRYANATRVLVSLNLVKDSLVFTIEDDGVGFDVESLQGKKSFGILGMKERTLSLGGKFDLVSVLGNGTKITVTIPV